jgi:hypothetical protein
VQFRSVCSGPFLIVLCFLLELPRLESRDARAIEANPP